MIGLAALTSQPQLAASISLAVLIAPVAFTTAMTSPAFVLSSRLGFDRFALSQGWGEWGSFQQATSDAMMPVCRWAVGKSCGSHAPCTVVFRWLLASPYLRRQLHVHAQNYMGAACRHSRS
jgi:hypothetical protein